MRRFVFASLLCALLFSVAARADTVFVLNGTLQDGTGVFHGTVTYSDFSKELGHVTGTVTDGSYHFTVPASYLGETLDEGTFTLVDVFAVNSNFDLSLFFPKPVGTNGAGGALCSLSMPCLNPFTGLYTVASSFQGTYPGGLPFTKFETLTATVQGPVTGVTPEPGTLALLATGLAGMWVPVRRRFVRG